MRLSDHNGSQILISTYKGGVPGTKMVVIEDQVRI